jgi:CubicO group peptidase (beta-lactamase class C family)
MTIKPESVGMCSTRLARLDRFLSERYIESGRLPCAQLQVMRDGHLVHQTVLGKASLETGAAMAEDTLVRIYSMTKPITSVAFMMLVEEGKVALDDPVHRFIPEWRDLGVYVAGLPGAFQTRRTDSPMRMIDLLRHTSGLTYGFQTRSAVDAAYRKCKVDPFDQHEGLEGFITELGKMPLEFSPGTAWNYSVSTDVLGYLVGKISGDAVRGLPAPAHLRAAGHGRHRLPRARRQGLARFAGCYLMSPQGKLAPVPGAASANRRSRPRAAAAWCRPQPTTCASAKLMRRGGALGDVRLLGPQDGCS